METYTLTSDEKLAQAQKKVKCIKGFYTHATVYLFVNLYFRTLHDSVFLGNWSCGAWIFSIWKRLYFWKRLGRKRDSENIKQIMLKS
jgi:hypothetical protein